MIPEKHEVRDGQFVSQRVAQVVEAIREYCPEIEVQWIPPSARSKDEAAFRLLHFPDGGEPYQIMTVKHEDDFDARVLKRIIAGDQRNAQLKYGEVEAAEEAARLIAKQRAQDEFEETMDKLWHVLKSPLNTYKLDENTTIKDGIPFNAKDY